MNSILYISAVTAILLVLVGISKGYKAPARALLYFQVFYWAFGYVARPLVLLIVNPEPKLNDSLADPRLASLGYDASMPIVFQPILVGLCFYVSIVWLMRARANIWLSKSLENWTGQLRFETWHVVAIVLGWAARFLFLFEGKGTFSSAVFETFALVTYVGLAGVLRYYIQQTRIPFVLIGILGVGEFAWSALSSSKTPVLIFVVLTLVFLSTAKSSLRKGRFTALIGLLGSVTFTLVQSLKLSGIAEKIDAANSSYPAVVQPIMPFLRRFDLFSAATDAAFFNSSRWLSLSEYFQQSVMNLVPQQLLGISKLGSGTDWSITVRSASLGIQNYEVSLADGFIAEGYLLGGLTGVVILAVPLYFCLIFTATRIFSNSVPQFTIAAVILTAPVLFERGFLAMTELLGKAVQVALLVVVIIWLVDNLVLKKGSRTYRHHVRGVSESLEAHVGEKN
jgi:hypothetical protein